MDIYELYELGKQQGLGPDAVVEHRDNPQGLCMGELAKRIYNLNIASCNDGHFRGGAWSGD